MRTEQHPRSNTSKSKQAVLLNKNSITHSQIHNKRIPQLGLPSSNMHALLQAVRAVDNRQCAECESQIGDIKESFAVLDYGVWVCNDCANSFMESGILTNSENMKTCAEDWVPEDIARMMMSKSNKAVNAIYERHVSPSWMKPTNQTTRVDRVNWILAKYKAKLFVFSQKSEPMPSSPLIASESTSRQSMDFCPDTTELPLRLLDFFVVVSPGDQVSSSEEEEGDGGRSAMPDVEEIEFTPIISSCFPDPETIPDTPLPEHLGIHFLPPCLSSPCLSSPLPFPSLLLSVNSSFCLTCYPAY